ncbi:coiled-coil domain-containing protein 43 [Platysternon megacephalum]|uniref:Coiled-coil domain-containing protein 43 n=1 Tax=Platysternon megacephalum TaxID=55544 RepID=A0A4D9E926_9SAUR|nr:coiled-coil domain-containing protein 43 [Platysternon megacephalum]
MLAEPPPYTAHHSPQHGQTRLLPGPSLCSSPRSLSSRSRSAAGALEAKYLGSVPTDKHRMLAWFIRFALLLRRMSWCTGPAPRPAGESPVPWQECVTAAAGPGMSLASDCGVGRYLAEALL